MEVEQLTRTWNLKSNSEEISRTLGDNRSELAMRLPWFNDMSHPACATMSRKVSIRTGAQQKLWHMEGSDPSISSVLS